MPRHRSFAEIDRLNNSYANEVVHGIRIVLQFDPSQDHWIATAPEYDIRTTVYDGCEDGSMGLRREEALSNAYRRIYDIKQMQDMEYAKRLLEQEIRAKEQEAEEREMTAGDTWGIF